MQGRHFSIGSVVIHPTRAWPWLGTVEWNPVNPHHITAATTSQATNTEPDVVSVVESPSVEIASVVNSVSSESILDFNVNESPTPCPTFLQAFDDSTTLEKSAVESDIKKMEATPKEVDAGIKSVDTGVAEAQAKVKALEAKLQGNLYAFVLVD